VVRRGSWLLGLSLLASLVPPPAAASSGRVVRRRVMHRRVFLEKKVPVFRNNLPNVQALGALVVDLDTGQELFSRRPDQPRSIASISKLAAMLVVADRQPALDELTTMKRVDIEVARGGAPSRLPEGMTLTNRDLLHAALLGSDNRAVSALGRAVGLGAQQFAEAMNRKVAELGLKHTHFREPTGLSPENVSTPREVLAMLRAAMASPLLGPVLRRVEYDAHPVARAAIRYVNTHRPAHRANTEILGGKTGYNDSARYCLVLASRMEGHTYGMSFLGTEGKLTRFGDVARTTDWLVVHRPQRSPAAPAPSVDPTPLTTALQEQARAGAPAPDGGAAPVLAPGEVEAVAGKPLSLYGTLGGSQTPREGAPAAKPPAPRRE
jgi:D-alanyl-D-alanine carboxypeptidase